MKHTLKVTLILVGLFLVTQFVGLVTVNTHISVEEDPDTGDIIIDYPDTLLGPPATIEHESKDPFIIVGKILALLAILILIGTALLILIIKYQIHKVWKVWFFLAVWATMAVAFGVYINWIIAAVIAFGFGLWKIYKPNVYVYNFTEIFIYTGITIMILPILHVKDIPQLSLYAAFGTLILISLYDMYAVWKSKHMVKMAKFQTKANVFAGLMIPYAAPAKSMKKEKITKHAKHAGAKKTKSRHAILGGGDLAFPLIFSAAVMEYLIIVESFTKPTALAAGGVISLFTAAALLVLLVKAEDQKFYPAMPFISIGCFIGFLAVMILF
ncbi:presenilin family intramembrane aspartyl protease [Thermoproteota archaeon]